MNAIDTNILLYELDWDEPVKQQKASELLAQLALASESTVLPWQVIGELVGQLRRWQRTKPITAATIASYVTTYRDLFQVVLPTLDVVDHALDLANRYSLSHWDSMLLGACKAAGVDTLYTEDMGSPIIYDGIRLVNPFV